MISTILGVVFFAGCVGGVVAGFIAGVNSNRMGIWYTEGKCRTRFPGFLGNVLLGGIAAIVFWALYGPFTGATIIGDATDIINLTIGQLAGCFLIGMGGPGFLLMEAGRRCADRQLATRKMAEIER